MKRKYTVILEKEEQGYHVFCPVLPGCHSQGETVEEALRNIQEAIGLYIESMVAHGEGLPRESQILIAETEIENHAEALSAAG